MEKYAEISKIKRALPLKSKFSETSYFYTVYLRAKVEVSRIILTSFRQGLGVPPQNEPLKSPSRLGFNKLNCLLL